MNTEALNALDSIYNITRTMNLNASNHEHLKAMYDLVRQALKAQELASEPEK